MARAWTETEWEWNRAAFERWREEREAQVEVEREEG